MDSLAALVLTDELALEWNMVPSVLILREHILMRHCANIVRRRIAHLDINIPPLKRHKIPYSVAQSASSAHPQPRAHN